MFDVFGYMFVDMFFMDDVTFMAMFVVFFSIAVWAMKHEHRKNDYNTNNE